MDNNDTQAASSADECETAAAPTQSAPETPLAWSVDDDTEVIQRQPWRSVWGIVGLALLCAAVVGVLIWAVGSGVWDSKPSTQPTTRAKPTVTSSATPAPPTSPPPATASDAANDQLFLQRLSTDGFNNNSPEMAGYAHIVCNDLRQGKSEAQVVQWLSAGPLLGMGREWLTLFVNDVKVSYPNCAPTTTAPSLSPQERDNQFLDYLQADGVDIPTGDAAQYAIENAHSTCDYLKTHSFDQAVDHVQRTTIYFNPVTAGKFVNSATTYYCPN